MSVRSYPSAALTNQRSGLWQSHSSLTAKLSNVLLVEYDQAYAAQNNVARCVMYRLPFSA
jgi:hypothetical protein